MSTSGGRTRSRPLHVYLLCVIASVAYSCVVLVVLTWRDLHAPPPDAGPSAVQGVAAVNESELLCAPVRAARTLLVEVPFTQHDVDSLELALSLWERAWPCYSQLRPPWRPDLVFGFNGNLSEPRHDALRERVLSLTSRRVVRECFGVVSVESAFLSGVADTYDKRRLDANWTAGPNNLFFHFLRDVAASRGYRSVPGTARAGRPP